MPTIVIDAGHGGYDNGASYQGRNEKDENLRMALAVGEILMRSGLDVEYTRVADVFQAPAEKAELANELDGDILVSFHRNSSPEPNTYSGVQSLIYEEGGLAQQLADNINQEVSKVGFQNLGTNNRTNLAILRRSEMPAVLVEVGFLNTDADNTLLDRRFSETAQAIADGIIGTLLQDGQIVLADNTDTETYRVQTGLFGNRENADRMALGLRQMGFPVAIEMSNGLYAVKVGNGDDLEDAVELEQRLRRMGYETLVVSR